MYISESNFWKWVRRDGECWAWVGCTSYGGGVLSTPTGTRLALYLAWEEAGKPRLPKHARLRNRCGKQACVNPEHWFWPTAADRFWTFVRKSDGCWIWIGKLLNKASPYGNFGISRREHVLAHRFSYALANGPIPSGMDVLHHCDNPPCVNPAHLFLGTDRDNVADKIAKKRHPHGERAGTAKLTEQNVRDIRRSDADALTLSLRYGVTRSTIYAVLAGQTWKHVH